MRGSDKKGDVVLILRRIGPNGLDGRHPERRDENDEHLDESHGGKETAWRASWGSPAGAIFVAVATQRLEEGSLRSYLMVALAIAGAEVRVPSDAVTLTVTTSPLSPLPLTFRSKTSVGDA